MKRLLQRKGGKLVTCRPGKAGLTLQLTLLASLWEPQHNPRPGVSAVLVATWALPPCMHFCVYSCVLCVDPQTAVPLKHIKPRVQQTFQSPQLTVFHGTTLYYECGVASTPT